MLDSAADPYGAVSNQPSRWLHNYVEPQMPTHLMWETHPLN